jgi:type IV pilus assembly protein PilC
MAKFKYTAKNTIGKQVSGVVTADNRLKAAERIREQQMQVILLKPINEKKFNLNMNIGGPAGVKLNDKVVFTRQLATLIEAGVPLTRSLQTLSKQTESKALAKILPDIIRDVEEGHSFTESLGKFPKAFSPVYVNMVEAGEAGGILDEVFNRLALQMEKDAEIRGKLKSAMTYPAVVMTITVIAFIYLMTSVVPKINDIIFQLGGEDYEPAIYTKAMLLISDILINYGVVTAIILGVGGTLSWRYFHSEKGRPYFDAALLKIPVLGPVLTKVAIARFARTFSSLSSAGVSVLESLRVTGRASGNKVIERHIFEAAKEVKAGKPLSDPLSRVKIFPPILSQMVAVGEETGQIDNVLEKLADFYEREVDEVTESLSSIIEPILIVILGTIVGTIALSVFGPLSQLTQSIGA